jgi:hypothetical protein
MEKEIKAIADYNEFMDSLGKNTENDNLDKKMKKVGKVKLESDYRFIKRYGQIKLYLIKYKLARYIKKQKKYSKLLIKYETFHKNLSLAIAAGFSNIGKHQKHLKTLTEKVSKINEEKNGNN